MAQLKETAAGCRIGQKLTKKSNKKHQPIPFMIEVIVRFQNQMKNWMQFWKIPEGKQDHVQAIDKRIPNAAFLARLIFLFVAITARCWLGLGIPVLELAC